jgi:hypothetical protein
MKTSAIPLVALVAGSFAVAGCAEALYPPRPAATFGPPIADPPPSRVVVHVTWSKAGMQHAVDEWLPKSGEGSFQMMGSPKPYRWRRAGAELTFDRGRLVARSHVMGQLSLLGTSIEFPIDLLVRA